MCKKRKEIWEHCPPFLIVSKDEVLVEVFSYVLCSSTAGNIDKSINRRRIFWSKSPLVCVLRTTYIIISSFIPQISCENAYGVSFVWKFMWEKVADDVFEREKVISYFIKYVDEMDALSRCVRYYPLDGVFSTCFGHVEQQSDTMSVKEKNLAQKSHWTWSSHNTRYDMCFLLIVLFTDKWARG